MAATEGGREKLKLQTNVPVEIALKFDEGKPITGDYGDSVMYTLADERLFFAPPIVAKKLTELGIVKGEMFRLCKAEVTRGNRRSIEYQVSRVEVEKAAVTAAAVSNEPASPGVSDPVRQIHPATTNPNPRGRDLAVQALSRAFEVSIDAVVATRAYAAERGLDLKFNEGNIISVAMSVYINAQKEGKSWAA